MLTDKDRLREAVLISLFKTGIQLPKDQALALAEDVAARFLKTRPGYVQTYRGMGLTEKKINVLRQLVQGKSQPSAARALNVDLQTVKSHLRSTFKILGTINTIQSVAVSFKYGVLTPDDVPGTSADPPVPDLKVREYLKVSSRYSDDREWGRADELAKLIPCVPLEHVILVLRALRYTRFVKHNIVLARPHE